MSEDAKTVLIETIREEIKLIQNQELFYRKKMAYVRAEGGAPLAVVSPARNTGSTATAATVSNNLRGLLTQARSATIDAMASRVAPPWPISVRAASPAWGIAELQQAPLWRHIAQSAILGTDRG